MSHVEPDHSHRHTGSEHHRRSLRIIGNVGLCGGRDVASLGTASHQDNPPHPLGQVRIAHKSDAQVRQRTKGK